MIINSGPFAGLRRQHYQVILADPPWKFAVRSNKGAARSPKYKVMSIEDIKNLPVADLAAKNCVLFMWVTDTHLEIATDVIRSWGFRYKTVGFYWAKTNRAGSSFIGMGYWTRANPEQCLVGVDANGEDSGHQWLLSTIGAPKRRAKNVERLIMTPRREHSRKPDELFERIEALVDGPYIELFSRESRPGWTAWGDDAGKFDPVDVRGLLGLMDDVDTLLGAPSDLEELLG